MKNYTTRFTFLITLFVATIILRPVVCSSVFTNSLHNNPAIFFGKDVNKYMTGIEKIRGTYTEFPSREF